MREESGGCGENLILSGHDTNARNIEASTTGCKGREDEQYELRVVQRKCRR